MAVPESRFCAHERRSLGSRMIDENGPSRYIDRSNEIWIEGLSFIVKYYE